MGAKGSDDNCDSSNRSIRPHGKQPKSAIVATTKKTRKPRHTLPVTSTGNLDTSARPTRKPRWPEQLHPPWPTIHFPPQPLSTLPPHFSHARVIFVPHHTRPPPLFITLLQQTLGLHLSLRLGGPHVVAGLVHLGNIRLVPSSGSIRGDSLGFRPQARVYQRQLGTRPLRDTQGWKVPRRLGSGCTVSEWVQAAE